MRPEREPLYRVLRNTFEGLRMQGWQIIFKDPEQNQEMTVSEIQEDKILVDDPRGEIPIDNIVNVRAHNPNPTPPLPQRTQTE